VYFQIQPVLNIHKSIRSGKQEHTGGMLTLEVNTLASTFCPASAAVLIPAIDGLRGPLVIHDSEAPFSYDEEVILTVSDWYHLQAPYLIQYFQSALNEDLHGGSEPVPNATLINEAQNVKFSIKPGKTYLFRIINMGAFAAQYLQFDQHDMTVVEIDGVYAQPHRVSQLFVAAAQRYSVIVKTKHDPKHNFAITAEMNDDMFDPGVVPSGLKKIVSMKRK
jgi:iron transport multicopper oxidase